MLHIATLLLFYYITQNTHTLSHCFDMIHIATLLLFCYIAQNTPTLPHCFDMLNIATLFLFCYILIYMNAYYITQINIGIRLTETNRFDFSQNSVSPSKRETGHPVNR
jgi:hypothetical protein